MDPNLTKSILTIPWCIFHLEMYRQYRFSKLVLDNNQNFAFPNNNLFYFIIE